jgi:hypothetical protein
MQRERAGSSAVAMLASQACVCMCGCHTASAERARGRGFKSRPVHHLFYPRCYPCFVGVLGTISKLRENILSMLQINGIRQTRIRTKSSGNLAGQKQDFCEGISALCTLKLPAPDFAITNCLLSNNSHSCPSEGSYVITAFRMYVCE